MSEERIDAFDGFRLAVAGEQARVREAVERAAEAIAEVESTLMWDEFGDDEREWYRKMAVAALEASGLLSASGGSV